MTKEPRFLLSLTSQPVQMRAPCGVPRGLHEVLIIDRHIRGTFVGASHSLPQKYTTYKGIQPQIWSLILV